MCVSSFSCFFRSKNRPFFVTGRSKSHPNATFDPWAGSSARDRPGIPPLPAETKIKVQVSAKWRHFCEAASCSSQSLCVYRCRWKSCTFARFKIWQCTAECFHICWSFCCSRSSTLPCPEGSFLAPEIGILFGDAVGASLDCFASTLIS